MFTSDTIYAPATPIGKSGICVIRISGEKALAVLQYITASNDIPKPRYARLMDILNPKTGEKIDRALTLWFAAPNSFTGEDLLELHIHGSRIVIKLVLELLSSIPDVRLAEPGEFSRRAFWSGKMDLTQAEGLADLINAETEMQHKQALRQASGEIAKLYESWRKIILENLAFIEAVIDFPDDEIPQELMQAIEANSKNLAKKIKSYLRDKRQGELLREGIYVAIIGAPNVGKSSLLNSLARRDVAITSEIAGTTRDIIEVSLNIKGFPLIIADTAGIRETEDVIENEGIKRALAKAEESDIKIVIFDGENWPNLDDKTLDITDDKTIKVLNKIDKLDKLAGIPDDFIPMSLLSGKGIDVLIDKLSYYLEDLLTISNSPMITRARYREHLNECVNFLENVDPLNEIVIAAENLRFAAFEIGKITGKIDVEEVLDFIFAEFCIGK